MFVLKYWLGLLKEIYINILTKKDFQNLMIEEAYGFQKFHLSLTTRLFSVDIFALKDLSKYEKTCYDFCHHSDIFVYSNQKVDLINLNF